ncbi:MAG: nucleotidyltransferase domain-containing protein [Hyphomonadaceae bacterium]|nr:nucleotidyltransferase domain-containing protein [Hyphomonadaceae bacterium]
MTREDALRLIRQHADELRRAGVAHVSLFGSLARDEAGPQSDVDLVVEPAPGRPITLFTIGPLQDRFAAILGRPVDVIAKSGFDAATRLKARAADDLVPVF